MNRPYLILLFAAVFFLVLIGWGLYGKLMAPPPAPAATAPATQPLVERLRAERERRMRERGELPDVPAAPATPATRPATAPAL